jgi:hypothetical protein
MSTVRVLLRQPSSVRRDLGPPSPSPLAAPYELFNVHKHNICKELGARFHGTVPICPSGSLPPSLLCPFTFPPLAPRHSLALRRGLHGTLPTSQHTSTIMVMT